MRPSLATDASEKEPPAPERTYTTKHGTTATMNTENIGHSHVEVEPQEVEVRTPRDERGLLDKVFSLAALIEPRLAKAFEGEPLLRKEDVDRMWSDEVKPMIPPPAK